MPAGYADRRLDESLVQQVVAAQFPEFDGQAAVRLGQGWDNETFVVGGKWVFRFPRRANQVERQQREEVILATVAGSLGSLIPKVRYRGRPGELFPYPFIGYRLLNGAAGDSTGVLLDRLAIDLADVLGRTHAVDPSAIPLMPTIWEPDSPDILAKHVVAKAPVIREVLSKDLKSVVDPWLNGEHRPPVPNYVPRFCHNDICAEHVLVNPHGTISGVIDWGDAMVTDPAVDFAGLITIAGWPFIHRVLAHYPLPADEQFAARLVWLTRTLTLGWLADAIENQEDIERHGRWVTRAFDRFDDQV